MIERGLAVEELERVGGRGLCWKVEEVGRRKKKIRAEKMGRKTGAQNSSGKISRNVQKSRTRSESTSLVNLKL